MIYSLAPSLFVDLKNKNKQFNSLQELKKWFKEHGDKNIEWSVVQFELRKNGRVKNGTVRTTHTKPIGKNWRKI